MNYKFTSFCKIGLSWREVFIFGSGRKNDERKSDKKVLSFFSLGFILIKFCKRMVFGNVAKKQSLFRIKNFI